MCNEKEEREEDGMTGRDGMYSKREPTHRRVVGKGNGTYTNAIHKPYANHTKAHTANAETHTARSQKKGIEDAHKWHANHTQNTYTCKSHAVDSVKKRQWKIHNNDAQTIRKTDKPYVENTHSRFIKKLMENAKHDTQTIRKTHTAYAEKNTRQVHKRKVFAIHKNDTQTIRETRTGHRHQIQKTHTASSYKGYWKYLKMQHNHTRNTHTTNTENTQQVHKTGIENYTKDDTQRIRKTHKNTNHMQEKDTAIS